MSNHETVNEILVRLFANILYIEEKCLKIGEFKDLTITEMHLIENIGYSTERTMSDTAKAVKVTSGTLTTAIDNLIKKGYVERRRSSEDRRVVKIRLTEKGKAAYKSHEDFHKDLVISALQQLNSEEEEVLIRVLTNIDKFFSEKYKYAGWY
ncbi:MAG TPA: MarR family winged helix-turn-helix transcriptional regulator [Sedimentibacter sp.]|jgi:DNA-binding MarR family transcriptional regulator|nr:MarR family winged helix-turn-helix transcriptional regulator [Sedimentibacter sp.]HPB79375.1 MarR family winged helix-turn-helix transcriptional regulator [Sedimentibacter sp.]HPV84958.1 MarR family winged helix-turn-helix transcriptional regulator [Sedimentibacter sp.]HPY55754.1 MarR family winged helix-turn-helix transcriptional regulator [Sedimentibacter sp.]HQC69839.1 MarR family winged helix-turn-helix transcriptional regulator [Sedimentibacter sp.]